MGDGVVDLREIDRRGVDLVLSEGHRRWRWALGELGTRPWTDWADEHDERRAAQLLNRLDMDLDSHIGARVRVLDPLVAIGDMVPGLRDATRDASASVESLVRRDITGAVLDASTILHLATKLERLITVETDELLPRLAEVTTEESQVVLRARFIDARARHPRRPTLTASIHRA